MDQRNFREREQPTEDISNNSTLLVNSGDLSQLFNMFNNSGGYSANPLNQQNLSNLFSKNHVLQTCIIQEDKESTQHLESMMLAQARQIYMLQQKLSLMDMYNRPPQNQVPSMHGMPPISGMNLPNQLPQMNMTNQSAQMNLSTQIPSINLMNQHYPPNLQSMNHLNLGMSLSNSMVNDMNMVPNATPQKRQNPQDQYQFQRNQISPGENMSLSNSMYSTGPLQQSSHFIYPPSTKTQQDQGDKNNIAKKIDDLFSMNMDTLSNFYNNHKEKGNPIQHQYQNNQATNEPILKEIRENKGNTGDQRSEFLKKNNFFDDVFGESQEKKQKNQDENFEISYKSKKSNQNVSKEEAFMNENQKQNSKNLNFDEKPIRPTASNLVAEFDEKPIRPISNNSAMDFDEKPIRPMSNSILGEYEDKPKKSKQSYNNYDDTPVGGSGMTEDVQHHVEKKIKKVIPKKKAKNVAPPVERTETPDDNRPITGTVCTNFEELLEGKINEEAEKIGDLHPATKKPFLKKNSRQFLSSALQKSQKLKTSSSQQAMSTDNKKQDDNEEEIKHVQIPRSTKGAQQVRNDFPDIDNDQVDAGKKQKKKYLSKGSGVGGGKGKKKDQEEEEPIIPTQKSSLPNNKHKGSNGDSLIMVEENKNNENIKNNKNNNFISKVYDPSEYLNNEPNLAYQDNFDDDEAWDTDIPKNTSNSNEIAQNLIARANSLGNIQANNTVNDNQSSDNIKDSGYKVQQSKIVEKYFGGEKDKSKVVGNKNEENDLKNLSVEAEEKIAKKYVNDKIESLNAEIARLKLENERVQKIRQTQEEKVKKLQKDREEFEKFKVEELEKLEELKNEELKKIKQERKIAERNSKAIANMPNRKEREEIEALKNELNKLKEEIKLKDKRNKMNEERLKKQIDEMQKEKNDLLEEVKQLEQLRLASISNNSINKIQSKAISNVSNNKYGAAIEKKEEPINNLKKGSGVNLKTSEVVETQQVNSSSSNVEITIQQSSKNMINSNSTSFAKETKAIVTSKDNENEEIEDDESDENNEENGIGSNDREKEIENYEDILVKNQNETKNIMNYNTKNDNKLAQSNQLKNAIEEKLTSVTKELEAQKLSKPTHPTGNAVTQQKNSAQSGPSLLQSLNQDEFKFSSNEYYQKYLKTKDASRKLINQTVSQDGKIQKIYADGKKEILFTNGVKREVFPSGYTIVHFANNDVKQTLPDGTIVYYFAEADTTQTTIPYNQTNIYRFSNKQTEIHYADGTKEIKFSDGTKKTIFANGDEETVFNDNTVQRVGKNRIKTIEYPNGDKDTIHPDGTKMRIFPSGQVKKLNQ